MPDSSNTKGRVTFGGFIEHAVSTENRPSYLPITAETLHHVIEVAAATAALLDLFKKSLYNSTPISSDSFDSRIKHAQESLKLLTINSSADYLNVPRSRLTLALLGIFTEAGELLETAGKAASFDTLRVKEELGDLNWYQAIALDDLNASLEEVLAMNLAKLHVRYGQKYTVEASLSRDLAAERKALQSKQYLPSGNPIR